MRKQVKGRTLSRKRNQRIALLRTLLVSLVDKRKIQTTLAKAKEFRPFAEKSLTRAKKATFNESNRPQVLRLLKKDLPEKTAKELIEIAAIFSDRDGGYTRIIKLPSRVSDSAQMAIVQWVEPANKKDDEKKEVKEDTNEKRGKKKEIKKDKQTKEKK